MSGMISSLSREFVLGGHLLALGTASMAAMASILLGKSPTLTLLVMAYLFSYGAYMMNRSAEIDMDAVSHPERTALLTGRRRYLPAISLGCFALGYALAITVNLVFFAALLVPLVLSVAYSVGSKRLVKVMGTTKLKEKLLVKNIVISFGWSLIPLLVGLYFQSFEGLLVAVSVLIFLRFMVSTLIFDIRDAEGDREEGIRTVPSVYGQRATYMLMGGIDVATLLYLASAVSLGFLPASVLVLSILPLYSLFYSALSRRPNADMGFICDVLVDGEYVFWGPLMFIGAAVF